MIGPTMGQPTKKQKPRSITEEQYDLLLESYREEEPPIRGAVQKAATAAGVTRKTAAKVWHKGAAYLGRGAIKELILEEKRAARAGASDAITAAAKEQTRAQAERQYAEAEKARQDVIKARRQEGEMVRAQRGNLMALIGVTGSLLRGSIKAASEIEQAIISGVDPATEKKLTLKDRVDLLWKVNRIVRQTASASGDVIRMERLLLGEPTEIVGMMELGDYSEEQALQEIAEAYEAAERYAERKGLKLIAGGAQ